MLKALQNDIINAEKIFDLQTVVHEIGHNLGMEHDFTGEDPMAMRRASNGQPCTGVRGFMGYEPKANKWSACSREDFVDYWDAINTEQGGFCLDPGEDWYN